MSEAKVNEAKPKKMVSRNVAVALGIICIVLMACFAGALVISYIQITNLQSQVNELNRIVNFQKTEVWLNNKTLTISPNQNVTEGFYAPLGGNVEVVGSVQPPSQNYWINLSWAVLYNEPFTDVYEVSPNPYVYHQLNSYFNYAFPVESFGQFYTDLNVYLTIGNNDPTITLVVNVTVSFTY